MPTSISIADGRKVVVEFDQPLVGAVAGNEAHFTASFDEYDKVPDGSTFRATRQATSVEEYNGINELVDFSTGTFSGLTIRGGKIEMEAADGSSPFSVYLNTTDGMTAIRNNSKQDDGVDTVTGVDWFTFNGVVANSIYVSGNSFVGFGANAEHLKICRRDGAMYYLYRQEGTIGATKFLKLRWQGYTYYSSTSAAYALTWELFLFSDGGLYLNLVTVPTNASYLGESKLVCGADTYNFAVTASKPVAYSFQPQPSVAYFQTADGEYIETADGSTMMVADGVTGKYTVSTDVYPVYTELVPSGSVEFVVNSVSKIAAVKSSLISWEADYPANTVMRVLSKVSGGVYSQCQNDGAIAGMAVGDSLTGKALYIKVEMSTAEQYITPGLKKLRIMLGDEKDANRILVGFDSGVLKSIQRAAGNVVICYNGAGTLRSIGGPVLAFEKVFVPVGLDPKNNPHNPEHIEVDIQTSAVLKRVYYSEYKLGDENITINVTVAGALIKIDDI